MNPRYAMIAACMWHVEGSFSTKSLGFKHRNPGNIEHADGTMHTYPTMQDGFNALVTDIAANVGRPLALFLTKYAPPSQNDTIMYVHVVSTLTGIGQNEPI